jgi:hypothetical protein
VVSISCPVAQKVDHDARIARVRRLEHYRQVAVVLCQLVLVQASPPEYFGGFGTIQPFDEALVVRFVAAADSTNPHAGVLAR